MSKVNKFTLFVTLMLTLTVMADVHADTTPPVIRIHTPITSTPAGQNLVIIAEVTDAESEVSSVTLFYSIGGNSPFKLIPMTSGNSTYTATIPAAAVTNKGLCYYIWAQDSVALHTTDMYKFHDGDWVYFADKDNPQNVTVMGATVTLPAGFLPVFNLLATPSKYRMISLPIDGSPTSTTSFAPFGEAGVKWKTWRFTGIATNNGFQPGHTDPFVFSPGVAAWVGTVNPNNALEVTGNTVDVTTPKGIPLKRGWNQIGNPFNFSRSWDAQTITVKNAAGAVVGDINEAAASRVVSNVIFWFTGDSSAYSLASADPDIPQQDVNAPSWTGVGIPSNDRVWEYWPGTLDSWGGYWLYAYKDATLLIDPRTPTKGVVPPVPSAPPVQMPYNWSVKLMAEAAGRPDAAKFAGIVADAANGWDKYDVIDLPLMPDSTVRLSFIHEDDDYLMNMKAPADEMSWQFKVSSVRHFQENNPSGCGLDLPIQTERVDDFIFCNTLSVTPVAIRFDARRVPSEYRTLMLVDTETNARINLREVASYSYSPSGNIRHFRLIISRAHPEAYAAISDKSELLQNFPNPFNPETWIPFQLAKAGEVTIQIYNVAGRLVRTLELGHREAGLYTVKEKTAYWDGKDNVSERVASGVYFYHILSGSFHATRRMVIVK